MHMFSQTKMYLKMPSPKFRPIYSGLGMSSQCGDLSLPIMNSARLSAARYGASEDRRNQTSPKQIVQRNIVRCRYIATTFLTSIYKIHPIARLSGRGMRCLLWVKPLICRNSCNYSCNILSYCTALYGTRVYMASLITPKTLTRVITRHNLLGYSTGVCNMIKLSKKI